jgi:hypothetical protein
MLVVALVLCASWTWSSIITMSRNWELDRKLESRRLERDRLELEVENLKLAQQFYLTVEYQELMVREKQGKMIEGETMVILPANSEAALNKYASEIESGTAEEANFLQWLKFLFG